MIDRADGLRVLHVLHNLSVSAGGPVAVVRSLLPELVSAGVRCTVAATAPPQGEDDGVRMPGIPVHSFPATAARRYWKGHSPALAAFLDAELRKDSFDLVHVHELWLYTTYAACRAAKRHAVPYIVTVHGEMDGPRMREKRLKKWAYMRCVQRRHLRWADAVQALTEGEAATVRGIVRSAPVFVLPNGTESGVATSPAALRTFENQYPAVRDKRIILYLGRLHKLKGVEVLARSFVRICGRRPDSVLLLAGPDYDGTGPRVERAMRKAGLSDRVVFTGTIDGPAKAAAFAAADVFVLPSYSEGFSCSVLEALTAGVPVVASEQCYFPEIAEQSAGFVIPVDEGAIAEAVDALLSDAELRRTMGENARALAREYAWSGLAVRMADRYRAVVERRKAGS